MVDSSNTRLVGWKEIARFLGVTVRAAQNWEKERGLPVHRMPGEARPRVYAKPDELEAWLSDGGSLDSPAVPPVPAGADTALPRGSGKRRWAAWFGLVVVAVAVVLGAVFVPTDPTALTRCEVVREVVRVEDARGELVWQRRYSGLVPRTEPRPEYPACVIADVEGDGRQEVLLHRQPNILHQLSAE